MDNVMYTRCQVIEEVYLKTYSTIFKCFISSDIFYTDL